MAFGNEGPTVWALGPTGNRCRRGGSRSPKYTRLFFCHSWTCILLLDAQTRICLEAHLCLRLRLGRLSGVRRKVGRKVYSRAVTGPRV